jgi:hypothetical protein
MLKEEEAGPSGVVLLLRETHDGLHRATDDGTWR